MMLGCRTEVLISLKKVGIQMLSKITEFGDRIMLRVPTPLAFRVMAA